MTSKATNMPEKVKEFFKEWRESQQGGEVKG